MAKPVALFQYPDGIFNVGDESKSAAEVINLFNNAMPDYYWLCFPSSFLRYPKLQIFYEKDLTEIEYDELVELVKKKIAKLL